MNATARKSYPSSRKKSRWPLIVFLLFIVLPSVGITTILMTFDLNAYSAQIADEATKALDRKVTLNGPLALSLTMERGLSLSAEDVTLANPSWASRPVMAKIGRAFVHVNWFKLLSKELDIVALDLEKADILLETKVDGANNWTFKPNGEPKTHEQTSPAKQKAAVAPVKINLQKAAITDSRFGMLSKEGKLTVFDVPKLQFKENGKGIEAQFEGTVGGVSTSFVLSGGKLVAISGANWPFVLEAKYGALSVSAKGSLSDSIRRVTLESLRVVAGDSRLEGNLTLALGGVRPSMKGSLKGQKIDPSDFALGQEVDGTAASEPARGTQKDKIFSRAPLPLDGLKAADVELLVTIEELMAGVVPVRNVILPIKLAAGNLDIAPFSGVLGGNKAQGRLALDARQQDARLAMEFTAKDAEMAQLMSLWGMESIITGKADVDFNVTASGRSSYDMASSANGTLNLLMDGGEVSSGVAKSIASGVLDLFAPGAGALTSPGVNCVAGRYAITNGLVQTKGLLIDTDATTISGLGTINLPDEHISMNFYTRPKVLGLGAALPPMKVYGNLSAPAYTLDAASVAQKVVGLLTKSATPSAAVPTLLKAPAGQNACAYTLDNPEAAKAAEKTQNGQNGLLPATGTLQDKIKGVGDQLIRGIGSGLFGK